MPAALLKLGTFIFQDMEAPNAIFLHSKERAASHSLGDGSYSVDMLGTETESVDFSGVFLGPTVSSRASELDALRVLATPQWLVWSSNALLVLIRNVSLTYLSDQWMKYSVSCIVVPTVDRSGVTIDPMAESTAAQIGDIASLMIGSGQTLVAANSVSMSTLIDRNFDVAPVQDLTTTASLIDKISSAYVSNEGNYQVQVEASASDRQAMIDLFIGFVSKIGAQACLGLAQKRLEEIVIRAIKVNSQ